MRKKMPEFKNEDEEREFWATHDSTEYIDWQKAERVTLSNLKPSVKKISLRLPESMLEELKRTWGALAKKPALCSNQECIKLPGQLDRHELPFQVCLPGCLQQLLNRNDSGGSSKTAGSY